MNNYNELIMKHQAEICLLNDIQVITNQRIDALVEGDKRLLEIIKSQQTQFESLLKVFSPN